MLSMCFRVSLFSTVIKPYFLNVYYLDHHPSISEELARNPHAGLNQVSHPSESLEGTNHAPLVGVVHLMAMLIDEATKEGEVVEGMTKKSTEKIE